MKLTSLWLTLACALSFGQPKFIGTSGGLQHYVEEVPVSEQLRCSVLRELRDASHSDFADDLDLDAIVNIGQSIWKIIEKNQPVLNTKYDYANALPKGVKSSEDLEGFSDIQIHALRNYGVNGFGAVAFDVVTAAVHRFGGSYDGVGQYLENVTLLPQKVEATWGYTLNMRVAKVSAVNVGTKAKPVGSVLMESELIAETVIKKSQTRQIFEFRGDSDKIISTAFLR